MIYLLWLFILPRAYAGNGPFSAALQQLSAGKFCGQVSDDELNKSGYNCRSLHVDPILGIKPRASTLLDKLVFAGAAERQQKADKCVAEALGAIKNDRAKTAKWEGVVATSWLGLKKSQLMREKCKYLFWNSINQEEERRYGLKKAYERHPHTNEGLYPKATLDAWQETCLNPGTRDALNKAEGLFAYSLPVVSSTEAFDMMGANRGNIVNRKTGKPLTDTEILAMDLTDLSNVTVKQSDKLDVDMAKFLGGHIEHRNASAAAIERAKANGEIDDLSGEMRDYLYQEGAVTAEMIDKGMLKVDMLGNHIEASAGAVCIMAWNEPSFAGGLADLAGTSLIPGGIIYKILGASAKFAKVGALKRLKSSLLLGTAVGSAPQIAGDLYRSCISSTAAAPRLNNMKDADLFVSVEGSSLPKEVGFDRWNFEFDKDEVPDCESKTGPNLLLNRAYETNCARDLLMSVLPIYVSLPAALISN